MPATGVLQMYLQEEYQCKGKYKGYKHQHPFGKHKSILCHNACALVVGGFREKETNQSSAATIHICSRFTEIVLIGVVQRHLLKRGLGLFGLEVNGQITIHK